jgi:hypothetical protein
MDGGDSWDVVLDPPGQYILANVVYDPGSRSVYVSGGADNDDAVLFYSIDDGDNWSPFPLNARGQIAGMEFGLGSDYIYVAMRDAGVLRVRRDLISVNAEEHREFPVNVLLDQNYPNPFEYTTAIRYSVASPTVVAVEIYALTGERVAAWPARLHPTGSYSVPWTPAGEGSGVYFCAIRTPDGVQVRKLVAVSGR